MNVAIEKLPECRANVTAEVPKETVEEIRKEVINAFMNQAKLPGFRPGKLPRKIVEQKFGPNIAEELKERLCRSVLQKAHSDISILGIAKIEREVFESDGSFSFTIEVVTRPDVELSKEDYENIEVEVHKQEISDEMFDEFISRIQKNFTNFTDSEEACEPGDRVALTFTATKDGKPLVDELPEEMAPLAQHEEDYHTLVPSDDEEEFDREIPGLLKGIRGMKAGETRDIEVDFGEEHLIPEVKGTQAIYSVSVSTVMKGEIPPVDDELAKRVGAESLEKLKENYRSEMEMQNEKARANQIDQKILEHLNKEHKFELPQDQVFDETQWHVNQMVTNAYQQGLSPDDVDQHEKDIVDSAAERAVGNLRTRYLLAEIAKNEDITVSDDDLSRHIMLLAQQEKKPFKKFARELGKNPGYDSIRQDIQISKTIAFLRENASVTEVDPPVEEAENADQE